jgi:hypothetical protein
LRIAGVDTGPEQVPDILEVRLDEVEAFDPAGPVCVGASSAPALSEKRQQ